MLKPVFRISKSTDAAPQAGCAFTTSFQMGHIPQMQDRECGFKLRDECRSKNQFAIPAHRLDQRADWSLAHYFTVGVGICPRRRRNIQQHCSGNRIGHPDFCRREKWIVKGFDHIYRRLALRFRVRAEGFSAGIHVEQSDPRLFGHRYRHRKRSDMKGDSPKSRPIAFTIQVGKIA